MQGAESCCSWEEAVMEGLLGKGSAGRVHSTRHDVHWHATGQLCQRYVEFPAEQHDLKSRLYLVNIHACWVVDYSQ